MARIADATIKPATGKDLTKYRNGDTGDIIKETLDCFRDCAGDVEAFATNLKANDLVTTCSNVWRFVKSNIRYKMDPAGVQWVRTPARLWKDKEGDCKSYSVTIACILHQLGINGVFRFVSFNAINPTPTHVYVVVPTEQGEIKIDAVLNSFNYEKPYFFKQDYPMTQISRLSGVNTADNTATIKRLALEKAVELKRGTLTPERSAKYDVLITRLQNGESIGFSGEDAANTVTQAASGNWAGAALTALSSILKGGGPNPNDWQGWSPTGADARHWTRNNGDSVQNEAVNILSWIKANGIQKMFESSNGVPAVTIQDIANKLNAGGFTTEAQQLVQTSSSSSGSGNGYGGGLFTNQSAAPASQSGMNTWVIAGLAAAALYAITRK